MYSARNSAKTIANDNPYCIQIATTSTAYREISSSVDLAGFRMKGNGTLNHAVLVVDDMGGQELYLEPDFRKVPTVGLDVGFGYSPLIQSWRLRADKDHQVEGQALQNGLIVEKVRGKSDSTTVQYYVEEKDGSTQTLIRCFDSMGYQCTHMFFDGEFSYYFHHMPSDLSNWKGMHERAKTVFRSFIKEKKA